MKIKLSAHVRLKVALRVLILEQPYFGYLAGGLKLKRELLGRTRTVATDGCFLYYDEKFIAEYPDYDLSTVLAHVVLHAALLHHTRRGDRDAVIWNDAGDYAINLLLAEVGFRIPDGWLLEEQFRGLTTREVFEILDGEIAFGVACTRQAARRGAIARPSIQARALRLGLDRAHVTYESSPRWPFSPGDVWDAAQPSQQEPVWRCLAERATGIASKMGRLPVGVVSAVSRAAG